MFADFGHTPLVQLPEAQSPPWQGSFGAILHTPLTQNCTVGQMLPVDPHTHVEAVHESVRGLVQSPAPAPVHAHAPVMQLAPKPPAEHWLLPGVPLAHATQPPRLLHCAVAGLHIVPASAPKLQSVHLVDTQASL